MNVAFRNESDSIHITQTFDAEEARPPRAQRTGWQAILDRVNRYVEAVT